MTADGALQERMRGELIGAGDPSYEAASTLYNAAIHHHPRLVARCRDVADVLAVVDYARALGLRLAVRGGGHNGAGFGGVDDGVVADLSAMRNVRVDPRTGTVRVSGGCVWGDVDHATAPFGLVVPAGVVSTTGVGGLSLGGGHGYLTRKYGLTIDNLLEVDVVLADGRLVTASAEQEPDLFWAIRGAGGNFGVVTSFLFQGQPVTQVHAGPTFWPIEETREALRWYGEFMRGAPDDVYGFFLVMRIPPAPLFPPELHGRLVCGIIWCILGPDEEARRTIARASEFRPPLFEHHGPMPLPALNALFDPILTPGLQWYWKGHFVRELTEEALAVTADFAQRLPSNLSTMHLYPIDGAASRVPAAATAFAYRDARFSMVIDGIDPEPANLTRIRAWARDYWRAYLPHSAGGGYVNFMQEEGEDRVRAAYRENYPRLVEVKTAYDPHNLFNVNWNIRPRTPSDPESETFH